MDSKKVGFLAFGLLVIVLLIWWAGIEEVLEVVAASKWDYLLLAFLMYISGIVLWGLRWRILLESLDIHAAFRYTINAIFIGVFFNNITPGARGGGEAMRMYYLSKRSDGTYGPVFATVAADRILDLIPVVTMLFLSTVYVYHLGSQSLTIILLVLNGILASLVVISLIIALNERRTKKLLYWLLRIARRIMPRTIKRYEDRLIRVIETSVPQFQEGLRLLMRDKRAFFLALLCSFSFWAMTLLRTYFVFMSINYPTGIDKIMVVTMVSIVVGLVSVVPGGAGLIEVVNSGTYVLLGIGKDFAVTATLVDRLISYWIPTFLGAALTTHFGARIREEKKSLTGEKGRD
ncbi:flippase-like domain-containing protein [Thermococcus sp.]|uniref:flippase-like domain-containing protein n=1 Tax=Thermococcus sp. TaxID=35749 RepID=UPI0025D4138D|nr:flippase-like domain-containing protein [Thermococcus sp.]